MAEEVELQGIQKKNDGGKWEEVKSDIDLNGNVDFLIHSKSRERLEVKITNEQTDEEVTLIMKGGSEKKREDLHDWLATHQRQGTSSAFQVGKNKVSYSR